MKFIKKFSLQLIILFLCCIVCSFGFADKNIVLTSAENSAIAPTIIIDAGHGGFDGGAVAFDGTNEKDINLSIALCLGDILSADGYKIIYTRTEDKGTEKDENDSISNRKKSDLTERLAIMKDNPDGIFVSIHLNKFTVSTAKGAQVFYSPNTNDGKILSECIQSSIISLIQPENQRIVKKANKSTYLLHNATIPAVIVECGFLSNKNELDLLKNESYQKQIAFACFNGIKKFYNLREGNYVSKG